jgi:hypothetical protein
MDEGQGRVWGISRDCSVTPALGTESGKHEFFVHNYLFEIHFLLYLYQNRRFKHA